MKSYLFFLSVTIIYLFNTNSLYTQTGNIKWYRDGFYNGIQSVYYTPIENKIIVSENNGKISFWDTKNKK